MSTPGTNQQSQNDQVKNLGQSYDLFAASNDDPWAKLTATKLGGGGRVIQDLVMLLQSLAGIENGGVAMSQNLRAGVMRGGISGITPGGATGMINGFDVAAVQASNALQQTMMRNFTNPTTGLANRHAQGLDPGELGRLGGYMLGQGFGVSQGPLFQGEIMTADRISALRREAQGMKPGDGREQKLRELDNMKVGELRLTETSNMGKFNKMMEDGAETLKAIKDVFGSAALKDLDDTFQQLLGGTLAEVGPRAARARMMGIKAMGTTFFGGDMQAAGTYSLGNQNGLAGAIGAGYGIDPATSREMFRQIAGAVAHEMDLGGLVGQQTQNVTAASVGKLGIGMKTAGAAEISELDQKDFAALLSEDPAAIALSHLMQTKGALASPEEKKKADAAFAQWDSARTAKERNDASARIESTFSQLSGGETYGNYLVRNGGTPNVLSNTVGSDLNRLAKSTFKLMQGAREDKLRGYFEDDKRYADLRKDMGLDAKGMGELGMNIGSMTDTDFLAVQEAMNEKDSAKRTLMLDKLGLSGTFQNQIEQLSGISGGLEKFSQVRANTTQYRGMKNFKSRQQLEKAALQEYEQMVKQNQYSGADNVDDFGTGLIRGLYGGRMATGRDVIEAADDLGLKTSKLSLDKKSQIQGTDANVEALMKHLGPEKLAKLGIKDAAGLREYLKSSANQTELLGELGTSGAFEFKGATLSLMDAASTEKGQTMLEDRAKENLLRKSGAESSSFKSEEYKKKAGESDVDFEKRKTEGIAAGEKRFKSMLVAQINKASRSSYSSKDPFNTWSKTDDIMKKVAGGDKEATALYDSWVKAGALSSPSAKKALMGSFDRIQHTLDVMRKDPKKGAEIRGMDEDTYAKFVEGRQANLDKIRDTLQDKDSTIYTNNTTMTVNGPVTISGKAQE